MLFIFFNFFVEICFDDTYSSWRLFQEKLQTGRTELEVEAMTSDLEISIKSIIRRIKELDQYQDSDSVRVGEIEHLQEIGEKLWKSYQDPKRELGKILRQYKDCENGEPSSKN